MKMVESKLRLNPGSKSEFEKVAPLSRVLGYRGFVVSCLNDRRGRLIANLPHFEVFLASAARPYLRPSVQEHIMKTIPHPQVLSTDPDYDVTWLVGPSTAAQKALDQCDQLPVVGPNLPPVYDPDTDDDGCFTIHQMDNNCYNYGTDIATDTFAQPGRGSGAKWQENTCEEMTRAAESDGAMYFGQDLPANQPNLGHFVALFIWPDTNFHWIRRDNASYWSHKPGGTPVRNTDNSGDLITDPRQSDFSPWTQFCSFFIIVPSNMTIQ